MSERASRRQEFRTRKLLETECSDILKVLLGLCEDHRTGAVALSMCAALLSLLRELPEAKRPAELKRFLDELDKFATWWGSQVFESALLVAEHQQQIFGNSTVNPASPDGPTRTKKRS